MSNKQLAEILRQTLKNDEGWKDEVWYVITQLERENNA